MLWCQGNLTAKFPHSISSKAKVTRIIVQKCCCQALIYSMHHDNHLLRMKAILLHLSSSHNECSKNERERSIWLHSVDKHFPIYIQSFLRKQCVSLCPSVKSSYFITIVSFIQLSLVFSPQLASICIIAPRRKIKGS